MRLRPVDQIQLLGGTGEGGVEPVDIIGREHVVRHVTLIHINMRPLSALRLMAGHGIGKLHLQGIEELVLENRLHPIRLERNILIIFFYLTEELLLLLMGQGWRLARQSIQQHRCLQLVIVIIGELQQKRGETETVKVDAATNPQDLGTVAIRKKSRKFFTLNFVTLNLELYDYFELLYLELGTWNLERYD